MTVSELQAALERVKAEHGDKPVYVLDGDDYTPLSVGGVTWDEIGAVVLDLTACGDDLEGGE